jgi:glutathione S-transferase
MKLYYSPGACSLASQIALQEIGANYQGVKVDLKAHQTEDGRDFYQLNPYGYVPALELDNGKVLSEGVAILQYIADQKPEAGLAPANGTWERYQLQSALTFVNSEVHKTLGAFFNPKLPDETRQQLTAKFQGLMDKLNKQLDGKDYLANNQYSVADAYLFTVLGWLRFFKMDLNPWPNVAALHARVAQRPAVQAALKAEGLA